MRSNGVDTLRVIAGWGNNGYQAGVGAYITPPTKTLPVQFLNNLKTLLLDIKSAGFPTVVLVLGGEGAYSLNEGTNLPGLVIPTYLNAMNQIVSTAQSVGHPQVLYDLGNEIAPSDYETASQINRTQLIQAVWSHYVTSGYPLKNASFSAIMDDSADFSIAGNRLNNLIEALKATGKPLPAWFDLHVYGDKAAVVRMLRGAYQIYSDHAFLSNSANPKWTMLGETYYESQTSVDGIRQYIDVHDKFNGQGINIRHALAWPVAIGYSYCPSSAQHVQSPLSANILKAALD